MLELKRGISRVGISAETFINCLSLQLNKGRAEIQQTVAQN